MLERLWWKEYRAFGPVLLTLLLAAGLLQWLFKSVSGMDANTGSLTVYNLVWAVLYAFASGAAAFSGERESKTLGFLDALPVPRGALWLGKASFALASTLGLALVLAGMAALSTEDRREPYTYASILKTFAPVLFEAVAFGLFWSSLTKNPLIAGVMGVLTVYASVVVIGLLPYLDGSVGLNDPFALHGILARMAGALTALAMSGIIMTWTPRHPRTMREAQVVVDAPPRVRVSSTGRSLAWQARREGWSIWLLVALVCLAVPFVSSMGGGPNDNWLDVVLAILAGLVGGVSVFGMENASGARRFLVHHGVKPGTVWSRKLLVWGLMLGSIFGLTAWIAWVELGPGGRHPGPAGFERFEMLSVGMVNSFAVGLLCGMTITRRITATMVGVLVLIAVLPIQLGLLSLWMVPTWSLALVPLIFVGASRAWAGDWLMEREGVRPWVKLAAWLVVPFGLLLTAYIGHRGLGLADIGPQFVASSLRNPSLSPDQDAAEAYRRAAASIRAEAVTSGAEGGNLPPSITAVIRSGWDPQLVEVVGYWKKNLAAIEETRKASRLPGSRFEPVESMIVTEGEPRGMIGDLNILDQLLSLDARERLSRGDLAGSWDDLLALFRMANQLGSNLPTLTRMSLAASIHHRAVALSFDWLAAPAMSLEMVRKALADLKVMPKLPDLSTTIQVESAIIERSLDLSGEELAQILIGGKSRNLSTFEYLFFARVVAPPWERERARRLCRVLVARDLQDARTEAYRRDPSARIGPESNAFFQGSKTLAYGILPNIEPMLGKLDRELANRRALEQAVAVEAWKLGHDGAYPETPESLVPDLLDRLPLDPFSGRPFRFTRSEELPSPVFLVDESQIPAESRPAQAPQRTPALLDDSAIARPEQTFRPGRPFLYSIGPDRRDDGGRLIPGVSPIHAGDLLYPIP